MMIAHPPCTYLCRSGLHWNKRRPGRDLLTNAALAFVQKLLNAPIPRIALENPIGCISTRIRKPDQVIQPWMFGHPETKATCLWLKNLPKLLPSNITTLRDHRLSNLGETKDRWLKRSITFEGIAEAMSDQWS